MKRKYTLKCCVLIKVTRHFVYAFAVIFTLYGSDYASDGLGTAFGRYKRQSCPSCKRLACVVCGVSRDGWDGFFQVYPYIILFCCYNCNQNYKYKYNYKNYYKYKNKPSFRPNGFPTSFQPSIETSRGRPFLLFINVL